MREYMIDHPGGETLDGLHSIAINVIGQAGFNQKQEWSPTLRDSTAGAMSGRGAYFAMLSLATNKLLESAMFSPRLLQLPFMLHSLRDLGQYLEKASVYLREML